LLKKILFIELIIQAPPIINNIVNNDLNCLVRIDREFFSSKIKDIGFYCVACSEEYTITSEQDSNIEQFNRHGYIFDYQGLKEKSYGNIIEVIGKYHSSIIDL